MVSPSEKTAAGGTVRELLGAKIRDALQHPQSAGAAGGGWVRAERA